MNAARSVSLPVERRAANAVDDSVSASVMNGGHWTGQPSYPRPRRRRRGADVPETGTVMFVNDGAVE